MVTSFKIFDFNKQEGCFCFLCFINLLTPQYNQRFDKARLNIIRDLIQLLALFFCMRKGAVHRTMAGRAF